MPDKQKVTLYLSDELHRQFKIRSAVDAETMSSIAQKALEFYLTHADLVQGGVEKHGSAHQVHSCPQCAAAVTLKDNSLMLIRGYSSYIEPELIGLDSISALSSKDSKGRTEENLCGNIVGRNLNIKQDIDVSTQVDSEKRDTRSPDEGELITC